MGNRRKLKKRTKGTVASQISWTTSWGALTPDADFLSGKAVTPGQASHFRKHVYVRAAIGAKARNIAQVPLALRAGPEDAAVEITATSSGDRGELWNLFNHPNAAMDFSQLVEGTVINLDQDGMAFWILERGVDTEIPKSMTPWRRQHFEPVYDVINGVLNLTGWFFTPPNVSTFSSGSTTERIALTRSQVVVFRYPNPDDPTMGISPLEAAARGITFDNLSSIYSESFFRNNGDPGGVIESPKRMNPKQAEDLRRQWEQRHKGPYNAHKVAVLWGEAKYKQVLVSNRDIQFVELRKMTRDEILAVLGVPKSEISIYDDLTHANAVSQNRSFWEKTLIPLINLINSTLAHQFTPGMRSRLRESMFRVLLDISSVPALQPELTDIIQNAERLWKMGWPINAINLKLKLGMPKVSWGDDGYANSALATFEDICSGEARKGSKPFNPSPPGPVGEIGSEGEEGEGGEDGAEGDKPDEDKSFQVELKSFVWRLRCHQLKLLGSKVEVFDRKDWAVKLARRFEGKNTRGCAFFTGLVHRNLSLVIRKADEENLPIEKVVGRTKEFFNVLSKDENVRKFVSSIRKEAECLGQ